MGSLADNIVKRLKESPQGVTTPSKRKRVREGQIPLSSGADRFDQVVERLYYFNDTYLEASEFIDRSLRERGIDTDRVDLDEIFRVLQLDVLNTLYVEVRALVANKRTVQMERKA